MTSSRNSDLVFECTDRYNENHILKTTYTVDNESYKDQILKLTQFQYNINELMTKLVDREKAELKDKAKACEKSDEEHYQSEESDDDSNLTNQKDDVDKKKIKLDK
jgi:hypothetical protein